MVFSKTNIMLKNQKYQYKETVTTEINNAGKRDPQLKQRKKETIEELSARKVRFAKTKSDDNNERKPIQQKKQKSLALISKEDLVIHQLFDEYQLHKKLTNFNQAQEEIQFKHKNNQILRDGNSFNNNGEKVLHNQNSKSRYKQTKSKAKQLIKKMITTSKTNSQEIANSLKNKITEIKTQVSNDKLPSNQYCVDAKSPQKTVRASKSSHFRPKIQKCSTLNFGIKHKNPLGIRLLTAGSSTRNQSSSSKLFIIFHSPAKINKTTTENQKNKTELPSQNILSLQKRLPAIKSIKSLQKQKKKVQFSGLQLPFQSSQKKIQTYKSINTVITSESGDSNENPLILKCKHLFSENRFDEYTKIRTQKQIIEETENAVKQVSKQLTISRKQSQKLITRARQKNKKIVGKLKEKREKRESLKISPKILEQIINQNHKNSRFQSDLDSNRSSSLQQSKDYNFLGLDSNIQQGSILTFNEEIKQKISIHLETIKIIANYTQTFTKIYQDCNEWEDLIFLLYKKYYIERYKIYYILKTSEAKFHDGSFFRESPFTFEFCKVSMKEIEAFRESKEEFVIELQLQAQNKEIKSALREIYNKFIQKAGDNLAMNMHETDDFSEEILTDLNEEISMLIQSCGKSQKIKQRINEAIQVGLMIAHLEGYTFDEIEEIIIGELDDQEYFEKFYSKFLELFQD